MKPAVQTGKASLAFQEPVYIQSAASIVGKKEGEGPLRDCFDMVSEDPRFGTDTWENAESTLQKETAVLAIGKAGLKPSDIRMAFAGDLLAQTIASSFGIADMGIPFYGLYGACSTMSESLSIGGMLADGGFADRLICATCSHFCTAERQYRAPLELGNQRPPTAQWTVTGAGAVMVASGDSAGQAKAVLTHTTCGRVIDLGITDANNMGAAMAPAACETLATHFCDMGRGFADYDLVVTGDLGHLGRELLIELLHAKKIDVDENKLFDCGCEIFSERQDTHSGGSGCGCAASMLCAHLLPEIAAGRLRRIVFMATGALLSTTTSMQGESVPGVAHAVVIEHRGGKDV